LINFAFNTYNNVTSYSPEPVSGGIAPSTSSTGFWYPSINPLNGRWSYSGSTYTASPYQYDTSAAGTWGVNGMDTIGGPKANWLTRYYNDFYFAIDREAGTQPTTALAQLTGQGTYSWVTGGNVYAMAPTSNPTGATLDFYPVSTWNTATAAQAGTGTPSPVVSYINPASNAVGYAIIGIARDVNGTRGISVYGWDARDSYWASAWASQYLKFACVGGWIPPGTVAIILQISYTSGSNEPSVFTIVRDLGTVTEFGNNAFAAAYTFDLGGSWSGMVLPPAFPGSQGTFGASTNWWWAKVPTTSTALVDFDS